MCQIYYDGLVLHYLYNCIQTRQGTLPKSLFSLDNKSSSASTTDVFTDHPSRFTKSLLSPKAMLYQLTFSKVDRTIISGHIEDSHSREWYIACDPL